jgi:putative peptide zinc metalloprotease protein
MNSIRGTQFRTDLLVMQGIKPGKGLQLVFTLKDLKSSQVFEFDREEYFLCQSWDGKATLVQILSAFEARFHRRLDSDELEQFIQTLGELGLLEAVQSHEAAFPSVFDNPAQEQSKYFFSLKACDPWFQNAVLFSRQFQWLWILLIVGSIPGIPLAILTLVRNWRAFLFDLSLLIHDYSLQILFSTHFIFTLINFIARIVQGVVLTHNGGKVKSLGFSLAIGFLPHIGIEMEGIDRLTRKKKLWVFGSALVTRLILLVFSVLLWFSTRNLSTSLHSLAILLALACCINTVLDGSPLWPSDGYVWTVLYFRLPFLHNKSRLFWTMLFLRRPLPPHLAWGERLGLSLFGLASITASSLLSILLILVFSSNISSLISSILGHAAYFFTVIIVVILFMRYLWRSLGPKYL